MSSKNSVLSELPMQARELSLEDIAIGQQVTFSWKAQYSSMDLFAKISGDLNPLHLDEDYAKEHGYDGRIVHGFLLGAVISGLIGMVLPGRRCLLLEEKLTFHEPIYANDDITFKLQVSDVHPDLSLIILKVLASKTKKTMMKGSLTCKLLY